MLIFGKSHLNKIIKNYKKLDIKFINCISAQIVSKEEYLMANHKSAKKRIRSNANRAKTNQSRISRIRTFIKKVEVAILNGNRDDAITAFQKAEPQIQKGVSKGVMHKNTAARKISRIAKAVKNIENKQVSQ